MTKEWLDKVIEIVEQGWCKGFSAVPHPQTRIWGVLDPRQGAAAFCLDGAAVRADELLGTSHRHSLRTHVEQRWKRPLWQLNDQMTHPSQAIYLLKRIQDDLPRVPRGYLEDNREGLVPESLCHVP